MPEHYFIFLFFTSCIIAVFFFWIVLEVFSSRKLSGWRYRGEKRKEKKSIIRWGGAVAVGIFLLCIVGNTYLVLTPDILWLLLGCFSLLLVGLWDDFYPLDWKWQLFWQLLIISCVVFFGDIAIKSLPNIFGGERWIFSGQWLVLGFFGAIMWFIFVINALNWIDGIDGLAPGIIVVASLALGLVALRPEVFQPPVAIVAFIFAGVFFALWLFNIFPARFFAGTSGVYVAGFVLAYLSLFAGAKMATAFLVLSIPLLDMFRVLFWRFFLKQSLAHADSNHIHHALISFGWSVRQVSSILLLFASFLGLVTLFGYTKEKIIACIFVAFLFIWFMRVEYEKKKVS